MRVIYCPSPYERNRPERRPKTWLLALPGVLIFGALAALRVGGDVGQIVCLLLAVVSALILGIGAITHFGAGGTQGAAGERSALAALAGLPDDIVAVVNFLVPGYNERGDLDLILIGPFGLLVIEVKNLLGPWRVDGDLWIRAGDVGGSMIRRSVSKQLKGQIGALKRFLNEQHAGTAILGCIAVNSNATIEIAAQGPYPIVPYDRLADFVNGLPALSGAAVDKALTVIETAAADQIAAPQRRS